MKKINIKKANHKVIYSIIILMSLTLILTSCSKKANLDDIDLNLKEGKYVLAFSGGSKHESVNSFSVLYEDGTIKEHPINNSIVIANAVIDGENLLFFSRQKNTHYNLTHKEIKEMSFLEDRYGEAYIGVLFANQSKNYLTTGINVGFSQEGYITELLYRQADETDFQNITYQDRLSVIQEIDKNTKEIIRETPLPSKYEGEPDRQLIFFGEDIIIYRAALNEEGIPTGTSHIAAYNSGNIIEEQELQDFIISQVHVHKNHLYLLDLFGDIKIYDLDFNIVNQYQLEDFNGWIKAVYFQENQLYVALVTEDEKLSINHYNLDTNTLLGVDEIPNPTVIDWLNESFTFLPIN